MKGNVWTGNDSPVAVGTGPQHTCLHPASRIEKRIGRGLGELRFLEPHWRSLVAGSAESHFIHTFEWQLAYLQHLEAQPDNTWYVSFFVDGRAVAIFPLRRLRRSVGRIPLWLWELPTHPHLILGEPLIGPEAAHLDLFRHLVKALNQDLGLPWDALHLPNLLEDSLAMRQLHRHSLPRTHLEQTGQSMYFPCADLEGALAGCKGPFRRNLRRQARKLAQQGPVTLTLARQGQELEAAFQDFLRLEASGWKGQAGRASAIRLHSHLLGFYSELKDRFARLDACLIALLKVGGVAIAAQFCLFEGSTLYIQKIAYDEAWSAEAPGNQLLHRVIEYCCGEPGIQFLSLVSGPSWAVGRWNPQSLPVWEAYIFQPSLRGLGGLVMRRLKTRVAEPARAIWQRARPGAETGPQALANTKEAS